MLNTSWFDTEEQTRAIGRELQQRRDIAQSDRDARSTKQQREPRTLRRAMGGALIAAGRVLTA